MTLYIVVDVGCIECGSSTNIVGVYNDIDEANRIANKCEGAMRWHDGGEHRYEVFEVPSVLGTRDFYKNGIVAELG